MFCLLPYPAANALPWREERSLPCWEEEGEKLHCLPVCVHPIRAAILCTVPLGYVDRDLGRTTFRGSPSLGLTASTCAYKCSGWQKACPIKPCHPRTCLHPYRSHLPLTPLWLNKHPVPHAPPTSRHGAWRRLLPMPAQGGVPPAKWDHWTWAFCCLPSGSSCLHGRDK